MKKLKRPTREVVQRYVTIAYKALIWIPIILGILQIFYVGDPANVDKLKDIADVAGAIAAQVSKKR